MKYLDFDLEIGPGEGREYPISVLHSPGGETRGVMRFPFDDIEKRLHLVELENALLRSATTHRVVPTREEQGVLKFGSALFNAVFTNEILNRFDVSLERAQLLDMGLRIKLRVAAPELAALPWEFMYDYRRGDYLCFSRQTPIIRYPSLPLPIKPLTIELPLRILGMVSHPSNLPQLEIEVEKERLEQPLRKLQQAGLIELHWLEGQTWRDLHRAMRSGPWHIFHFIGHGGFDNSREEGFLALCNDRGERSDIRASDLALLLANHKSLRLVILNACEGARSSQDDIFSSTAAILLRGGIPAVLAMQYSITDLAAVEFTRTFYEALADGMPVDAAVAEGRIAIKLAFVDTIEWGTPVLYLRAEDSVLFVVEKSSLQQASKPLTLKDRLLHIDRLWWATGGIGLVLVCLILVIGAGIPQSIIAMLNSAQTPTMTQTLTTSTLTPTQPEPTQTPTSSEEKAQIVTDTPTAEASQDLLPGATKISSIDNMVMVYVPEREFLMGCDPDHNGSYDCEADELPLHTVYLDAYWIDQTVVTNGMYAKCVDAGDCDSPEITKSETRENYFTNPEFSDFPVIYIYWEDAIKYCTWAGKHLPSEAEWEKSARGDGDFGAYPWGDEQPDCTFTNFDPGYDCVGDTSRVGSYKDGASPYGVLDLAGNVWEWVNDWYRESYYISYPQDNWPKNPRGPGSGEYRILRGGAWNYKPGYLRVASRLNVKTDFRSLYNGFRCAASAGE